MGANDLSATSSMSSPLLTDENPEHGMVESKSPVPPINPPPSALELHTTKISRVDPRSRDASPNTQSKSETSSNTITYLTVDKGHNFHNSSSNGTSILTVPKRPQSPDNISLISADDFSELRRGRSGSWTRGDLGLPGHQQELRAEEDVNGALKSEFKPKVRRGWLGKVSAFWVRNKGLALVFAAQFFAACMSIATRMLENAGGDHAMHPFQILFARMSITCLLSTLYMWYKQTPDFPLGAKGIRFLLVCRGLGGFWGVYGLYWSLQYLPLADATVLTFLAPLLTCYVCSKLIKEPFTRVEQIAGIVSMAGVVFVARPTYLFDSVSDAGGSTAETPTDIVNASLLRRAMETGVTSSEPTPRQRLAAVGMSMIGVLGAATAYVTIRWIGKRAHPLISVNYFAAWCTIVSTVALVFVPSIPFKLPANLWEWTLLLFIGVSGFVMQYLLTAGLRYEKSSRATNMSYTHMLFALAGDKIFWGVTPGLWSMAGSTLILGSAIVVALQKQAQTTTTDSPGDPVQGGRETRASRDAPDEELGLVANAEPVETPQEHDVIEMTEHVRPSK